MKMEDKDTQTQKDETPYEQLIATIKAQDERLQAMEKKLNEVTSFNKTLLNTKGVNTDKPKVDLDKKFKEMF